MSIRLKKLPAILATIVVAGLWSIPGPAIASTTAPMQASAIIAASRGTCSFDTGGPYAIAFSSAFNPLTASLQTASVTFTVTCRGLTGSGGKTVIIDRVGSGQLYLKNGPDQIPYSMNLPFSQNTTNNKSASVTLTATVAGTDYVTAPAGSYSDTITLDILP